MNYCAFVEYYRRQSAPRAEAISLPGVGGGWRKVRNDFGSFYQQDDTGYALPADQVESYLQDQRERFDAMLAEIWE